MNKLDNIAWRLIEKGSFSISEDPEFKQLTKSEQDKVRRHVRFELLMNE